MTQVEPPMYSRSGSSEVLAETILRPDAGEWTAQTSLTLQSRVELLILLEVPLRSAVEEEGSQNGGEALAVEYDEGTGLGELSSLEEGRDRLAKYVQSRPLESWAGPIAGASDIEKRLQIARSTLYGWHRRGAVIRLLRDSAHVYPLDQFVNARPIQGVADVAKIAPDERAAWLWLRQPHGRLDMRPPLDLLKAGRRAEVIQAAERDFI